jgi:hypothetical protein
MKDYEPIDLGAFCNTGFGILRDEPIGQPGSQTFQGLPFVVGGKDVSHERCLLAFGEGFCTDRMVIPINKKARYLIVAHRLMESKVLQGGPIGEVIAEYVVHFEPDQPHRIPIRERFEIAEIPCAGDPPFLAVSDQKPSLYPRYVGPWDQAGSRPVDFMSGRPRHFVLWAWENVFPERTITGLEILPSGPQFVIGGVTLGHLDENPFPRKAPVQILITLETDQAARTPFTLEVDVDRGICSYPYALPEQSSLSFLKDGWNGWGEPQNLSHSPAYVEVCAIPSATLLVMQGEDIIGKANFGELQAKGHLNVSPNLTLSVFDPGRNWVHTRVVDENTKKPVPCRIHFRSPEGIPFAPHGHHAHAHSNLEAMYFDVGGDVRLGQITYASIDGTCQGWLPRGEVLVDVARGFEYEPLRTSVTIKPEQSELELCLKRVRNMKEERWFSGDPHVHFLSTRGCHLEAQGEGLNVVNLLATQWGSLFTSVEEITGIPSVSGDGESIVFASQENRQNCFGHIYMLGIKKPVMPWCSDGLPEAEMGGTMEVTLSHWADQCHSQGGLVVLCHFPVPNGELAALIATGRADAIEMTRHYRQRRQDLEYYRYLNGGYRLPVIGGTDKMGSYVPVGLYRTYVHIPPELMSFSMDGEQIGDTLILPSDGGVVEVQAEAESILPIHTLEVVQEGQIVASAKEAEGTQRLSVRAEVEVSGHSWMAARCSGVNIAQNPRLYDAWGRGISAHTSPIYLACGGDWWMANRETAQYMLKMIEGNFAYIREMTRHYQAGKVIHHHGESDHLAYLERPLHQAKDEILQRIQRLENGH